MNLFGKTFLGPLKLNFEQFPNSNAIYIIAFNSKSLFAPLYIGITSRLRDRIKSHSVLSEILVKFKSSDDISIYYWEFDDENKKEAHVLELVLVKEYEPEFNKVTTLNESLSIKFNKEIDSLKKEEEARSKQWFKSSVVVSMIIVVATVTFYSSVILDKRQNQLKSILEKELNISNQDFIANSELAKIKLDDLLKELSYQYDALQTIELESLDSLSYSIPKEVIKLNSKVSYVESKVRKLEESNIIEKMTTIERSLEGSAEKILSVPLIRNDLKNYKLVSDKEFFRLEKSIDKLESRLSIFETITFTLLFGIFTGVVAPIFVSSFQNKQNSKLSK